MAKKVITVAAIICLCVSMLAVTAQEQEISVFLDGEQIVFDVPPQTINDRTMVPMRAIFEALGATVDWNEEEQSITSTREGITIYMAIDNPVITVNGEEITLDVAPVKINDRTLVPIRAVAESFEAEVLWDEDAQRVDINTVSEPSASPEPSGSPDPTASPDPSASPEPSASVSPTASPSASPSGSPSASPSATPSGSAEPSVSPSATPDTSGISFYTECPDVPDLGEMAGVKYEKTSNTDGGGFRYYYKASALPKDVTESYQKLMEQAGFTSSEKTEGKAEGDFSITFRKDKVRVIVECNTAEDSYTVSVYQAF